MGVDTLLQVVKDFGPLALVIAFFVWKDWQRENRLQDRIDGLENQHKDVVLPLVEKCSAIIAQNTAVMVRLERVLDQKSAEIALLEKVLDRQAFFDLAHKEVA